MKYETPSCLDGTISGDKTRSAGFDKDLSDYPKDDVIARVPISVGHIMVGISITILICHTTNQTFRHVR